MRKTEFMVENDILIAPELAVGLSCMIGQGGATTVDGVKVIKAGTPLYGSADVRVNRNTVLTATATGTCQGLARHDVYFTNNEEYINDTLLIEGFVDIDMLASDVVSKITADVKTALPHIQFIKGDA